MTTHRLLWISLAASVLLALSAAASAQTVTPTAKPLFMEAPDSPFRVGREPVYVAVGDFNRDGKLDLAIANMGPSRADGSVTVLLGNGKGGFTEAPGSPFPAGSLPESVAVGDFNGDGKADLAIADCDRLTLLLGDGKGGFTAATGSPVKEGSDVRDIAVGDFNGDGKLDLAITTHGAQSGVMVLLGDGKGGFTLAPGGPFPAGSYPASLAAADFNGDGKLDLAVVDKGRTPPAVTVLLGNGAGGFTAASGSPVQAGRDVRGIAVGDFNGDGKPDLVVANPNQNSVTVLLGDGKGGFVAASGSPFAEGIEPDSVAVGDFNGDGKPDLAVVNHIGHSVTVLLNNSPGPAAPAKPQAKPPAPGR